MRFGDILSEGELKWAVRHLKKRDGLDLLPPGRHYEAIDSVWSRFSTEILNTDVSRWRWSEASLLYAPKSDFTYRPCSELHPIDTIIITAITWKNRIKIEDYRIPISENIVFSNRIRREISESFFESDGWKKWNHHSAEVLRDEDIKYVVKADIVDFYHQISTHRINTSLQDAGVTTGEAEIVEAYLLRINSKISRAIPVGPTYSAVFAETYLTSIDQMLKNRGYKFSRYVDDFRFFAKSFQEASEILYTLHVELGRADHRLTLNSSKTSIITAANFRNSDLLDPDVIEHRSVGKRHKTITKKLVEDFNQILRELDIYPEEVESADELPSDLQDLARVAAQSETFAELFEAALTGPETDLKLARHLIRRSTSFEVATILDLLFANLARLAPCIPEVARYIVTLKEELNPSHFQLLDQFISSGPYATNNYLRRWWLYVVREIYAQVPSQNLKPIMTAISTDAVDKELFLAAINNDIEVIRKYKDSFETLNLRQFCNLCIIINALSEKRFFKKMVNDGGDPLRIALANLYIK